MNTFGYFYLTLALILFGWVAYLSIATITRDPTLNLGGDIWVGPRIVLGIIMSGVGTSLLILSKRQNT